MALSPYLRAITEIGAVGYVLPFTTVCLAALASIGAWLHAVRWFVALSATILVLVLLRLLLRQDPLLAAFPSGHVALATVNFGVLLTLVAWQDTRRRRLAAAATATIGLVVAIARQASTGHSWLDVIGALLLAFAVLLATGAFWGRAGLDGKGLRRLAWGVLGGLVCAGLVGPALDALLRDSTPF